MNTTLLRRLVFCLIGTLGLALLLPWGIYWLGLSRLSHYPEPPVRAISAVQHEWVRRLAGGEGDPVVTPLTPFSYGYAIFAREMEADKSTRVIGLVASDHLSNQEPQQRMLWRHLSGAALTIWLSRNWTEQQITAAALVALQRRPR